MSRAEEMKAHIVDMAYDDATQNRKFNLVKTLGLTPKKDGNMWCFLWGENLQEGVAGFGKTISAAAEDFEVQCYKELTDAP